MECGADEGSSQCAGGVAGGRCWCVHCCAARSPHRSEAFRCFFFSFVFCFAWFERETEREARGDDSHCDSSAISSRRTPLLCSRSPAACVTAASLLAICVGVGVVTAAAATAARARRLWPIAIRVPGRSAPRLAGSSTGERDMGGAVGRRANRAAVRAGGCCSHSGVAARSVTDGRRCEELRTRRHDWVTGWRCPLIIISFTCTFCACGLDSQPHAALRKQPSLADLEPLS